MILLLLMAVTAAVAEPVTLEYKYTKGDIDKYRLGVELHLDLSQIAAVAGKSQIPPMDISLSMNVIQKTLDVYSDGSAKVKVTYSDPVIHGLPIPAAAIKRAKSVQRPIIMRVSKRGQTISIQGLDKLCCASGMGIDVGKFVDMTSGSALLPEGPVEVGQSWRENFPLPFENSQFYMQSTFAGDDEEIWNVRVARIKQTCAGSIDLKTVVESILQAVAGQMKQRPPDLSGMAGQLTIDGDMTSYFAPSIGKLLKSQGTLDANVNVTLPPELTKQGAPPTLECSLNLRMAMSRFN